MNRPIRPLLILVTFLTGASAASAQVTSNLDDLPPKHPAQAPHRTHQPASQTPRHASARSEEPHGAASPPAQTVIPAVPAQGPPPVILPPPFAPVALHPPVPPEDILPVPDAKSRTLALKEGALKDGTPKENGLRVLFASQSADMNTDTIASIKNFGEALSRHPEKRLILTSYATLPGDDVSMPRRIALARALAVRSLLIRSGIATTRLYPRALGRPETGDHAPPDRLDITMQGNFPASPPETQPSREKSTP